jgi:hypothetical protein
MTWLPWLVVLILVAVVIWLLLALSGAGRTMADLRAAAGAQVRHLSPGIEPGTRAPGFTADAADGSVFDAHETAGLRHLVLFADPDCAACATLVPGVLAEAAARRFPAVVLVSRGDLATHPSSWRTADRARLVSERGTEASDAFGVDVTPTAFVIDEGGAVVARGPVQTVPEVAELVAQSEGMRIVGAGGG